jgi:PiT family inorganic phosphate transporter
MTAAAVLIFLAILFGFYVAWNIGANDVANAVGTSVGSGALTLKQAVLIAAIFEFCGAFFLGSNVSETLESGIVNPNLFSQDATDYVYGMLASLLACGLWLQFASFFGLPVSTTHTIVGAVLGFGLVLGGFESIFWGEIGSIATSWVVSPLLGAALSYIIFTVIRKKILYQANPIAAVKSATPYIVFSIFFILSLIIFFGGLSNVHLNLNFLESIGLSITIGMLTAGISIILLRNLKDHVVHKEPSQNAQVVIGLRKAARHLESVEAASLGDLHEKASALYGEVKKLSDSFEGEPHEMGGSEYRVVEKVFIYLQIVTACFMAFAHGSNDVANAIGPLSAILNVLWGRSILDLAKEGIPAWLLLLGGVGIVIGLATWGWRVIETVGRKITELTPSRGFSAGFGAATTIVLASKLGLPISTTHVLVGAVLGVGLARGIGAINLNTIRDIVISWVVTVPAGAALSVVFFYTIRTIFS